MQVVAIGLCPSVCDPVGVCDIVGDSIDQQDINTLERCIHVVIIHFS